MKGISVDTVAMNSRHFVEILFTVKTVNLSRRASGRLIC